MLLCGRIVNALALPSLHIWKTEIIQNAASIA